MLNHLKQWWALHSAWVTAALYFFVPSIQAWMNAHPKTVAASVVGTILAVLLQRSPLQKTALAVILSVAMLSSCNAATVQAYINLAVGIVLQVAKLAGVSPQIANQVSADLATVNKLVSDYQAADATAKPGILSEINTYLNVAESDLSGILAAVRVVDPKLQATIQASIGIAITAVESIRQLENAKRPNPVTQVARKTASLASAGIIQPGKLQTPAQLKSLYNQTVSAYPSAQLK